VTTTRLHIILITRTLRDDMSSLSSPPFAPLTPFLFSFPPLYVFCLFLFAVLPRQRTSCRMAATSLLNGSTSSSSREQRQQHNYGSIRDPQSLRADNNSEGEVLDTSGYGARSRSSTRGSVARHSVLIAVPEHEEIPEEDCEDCDDCDDYDDYDDNASCISRSTCSTSSSCLSIESLPHGEGDPCHPPSKPGDGREAGEEAGSRQLFWIYVALTPVLLFIWSLFVGVLWLLPSSEYETIVAWSKTLPS